MSSGNFKNPLTLIEQSFYNRTNVLISFYDNKEVAMNLSQSRKAGLNLGAAANGALNQRGKAFGLMILGALLAFEVFNFSTTEFALNDVLGSLTFMGVRWATILSIAFCGIDFAGIARIFTPEQGRDEPVEVWYLFGAWILAAAMNATLTWWGVSVAITTHVSQGSAVIGSDTMRTVVPVFVAVMVWVIRILIIGTFSVAGERLFTQDANRPRRTQQQQRQATPQRPMRQNPVSNKPYTPISRPVITTAANLKTPSKPPQRPQNNYNNNANAGYQPQEPVYTNLTMGANQNTERKKFIV